MSMTSTSPTHEQLESRISTLERERDLARQSERNCVEAFAAIRAATGQSFTHHRYVVDDVRAVVTKAAKAEALSRTLAQSLIDLAIAAGQMDPIRRGFTLTEPELVGLAADLATWAISVQCRRSAV